MSFFTPTTITTDAALRDLSSPRAKARIAAASALGGAERSRTSEVCEALVRALDDSAAEVRAAAALSTGDLGDAAATEALIARLDDGAPAVRQCAAIALGQLKAKDAFAALAERLAGGPPDLRFQAATSLVEIDPERAIAPLIQALSDADSEVVGAAALALGSTGDPRATEPLAARLGHPAKRTRFDVAYGLAELGDPRAAGPLAEAAGERDLSWDAIEALEALGGPAAGALAQQVIRPVNLEHQLRAAAALLAVAPDHEAADPARRALVQGLSSYRSQRRGLAVQLLGRVGGPWAVAALEKLAHRRAGRALAGDIAAALARSRTPRTDDRDRDRTARSSPPTPDTTGHHGHPDTPPP